MYIRTFAVNGIRGVTRFWVTHSLLSLSLRFLFFSLLLFFFFFFWLWNGLRAILIESEPDVYLRFLEPSQVNYSRTVDWRRQPQPRHCRAFFSARSHTRFSLIFVVHVRSVFRSSPASTHTRALYIIIRYYATWARATNIGIKLTFFRNFCKIRRRPVCRACSSENVHLILDF